MCSVSQWLEKLQTELRLPSEKELRDDFPHHPDCLCNRWLDHDQPLRDVDSHILNQRVEVIGNLEQATELEAGGHSHWSGTIYVKVSYLRCKHCGQKVRYAPTK